MHADVSYYDTRWIRDDNAGLDSRMHARYRAQYDGPPVAILDCSGTCSLSHTSSHHPSVGEDHPWLPSRGNDATGRWGGGFIYQRLLQFSPRSRNESSIILNRIFTCVHHWSSFVPDGFFCVLCNVCICKCRNYFVRTLVRNLVAIEMSRNVWHFSLTEIAFWNS